MKFIIDEKIYDTDNAELILEYHENYQLELIPSLTIPKVTRLYRTARGNWFSIVKLDFEHWGAQKRTEQYAREVLSRCGAIDIYNKYFGELEEA